MADKPTDDPTFKDKQKQAQQRKQRGGLAAAFVAASLLVPSGWFVADRYVYGASNFEQAVTQNDYATAQDYVARLDDEDMARFLRHAASTGDVTLLNVLLVQDDANHYGYGVANGIKDDIVTLAAQGRHPEILRNLSRSSNIGYISADDLFVQLARSGDAAAAVVLYRAMDLSNVWVGDAIRGALASQHYQAAAEIMVAIAPRAYISQNYSQFNTILRGLTSSGHVQQAIDLAGHFNQRDEGIASVMVHLASQGQTQALLDLAYSEGLASQALLENVYVAALLGRQVETIQAIEDNFDINGAAGYRTALYTAAAHNAFETIVFLEGRHEYSLPEYMHAAENALAREQMHSSVRLVNAALEKFPEGAAVMVAAFFEDWPYLANNPRLAFEFARQINMPDSIKSRVADSFTGTMDDALRVHWGIAAASQEAATQGATAEDTQAEGQDTEQDGVTPQQTIRSGAERSPTP